MRKLSDSNLQYWSKEKEKVWAHTNSNSKTRRHKRFNSYQIIRDYCKRVIVDAKDKSRAGRAIDQPNEVLLARRELRFEITPRACGRVVPASVDDDAVCSGEVCRCFLVVIGNEGCLMDIILYEDGSQVYIPICTIWSVNDEWTDRAL